MSIFGDDINYNLEFRSTKDDGWYTSGVLLDHPNRLRVKFKHLDHISNDEVFSVSDFSSNDDVSNFISRFRPESDPVGNNIHNNNNNNSCSSVSEGLMVSVKCPGGNHLRKFDAVVEAVFKKKHSEEKCLCTCLLFWQHGPKEGHTTSANLCDVNLIMSGSIDPIVVNFTKLVKEKVNQPSSEFTLIPKNPYLSKGTSSNETITKAQEFGSAGQSSHDRFSAGSERLLHELSDEGRDLECEKETGSHHYLILENLETDFCPLFLIDFIHEHTLVTAQAYNIPSLLSETYARAAIVVDNRTELERIYEFLNNPDHIIVSSSGRPLVLAEDKLRTGTFKTNLHGFPPMSEIDEHLLTLISKLDQPLHQTTQKLNDMSSSSTAASSGNRNPKIFKVDLDANVYCHHDSFADLRVAGRKSLQHGERFYGCPNWPISDCKFCLWEEDVENMFKSYANGRPADEEMKIQTLELHKKMLEEKNKRLKACIMSKSNQKVQYVIGLVVAIIVWWIVMG